MRLFELGIPPRAVAPLFLSRARLRLAVYTHLVLLSRPGVPVPTETVAQTREAYDGPLEVGADLMRFDIRSGEVSIRCRARRGAAGD